MSHLAATTTDHPPASDWMDGIDRRARSKHSHIARSIDPPEAYCGRRLGPRAVVIPIEEASVLCPACVDQHKREAAHWITPRNEMWTD